MNATSTETSKPKPKRSRRRINQVNEASKRCRQRRKEELLFLRKHVKELEARLERCVCESTEKQNEMKLIVNEVTVNPVTTIPQLCDVDDLRVRVRKECINGTPINTHPNKFLASEVYQILNSRLDTSTNPCGIPHFSISHLITEQKIIDLKRQSEQLVSTAKVLRPIFESSEPISFQTDYMGYKYSIQCTDDTATIHVLKQIIDSKPCEVQEAFYFLFTKTEVNDPECPYLGKESFPIDANATLTNNLSKGQWLSIVYGDHFISNTCLVAKWEDVDRDECFIVVESIADPELLRPDIENLILRRKSYIWMLITPYRSADGKVQGSSLHLRQTFSFDDKRSLNPPCLVHESFDEFLNAMMKGIFGRVDASVNEFLALSSLPALLDQIPYERFMEG